jgi:hypothetical protein
MSVVRRALEAAGVPASDPLLEFHDRFAGYVEPGPDEQVWGLVHRAPRWLGELEVSASAEDGRHYVICADVHPSYDMQLDQEGVHYTTCTVPRATSFAMMIEQHAFLEEFCAGRGVVSQRLQRCNDRTELREVLLPRVAEVAVAEVSDVHGTIYATDEWVLAHYVHFEFYLLHVIAGKRPAVLRDLRWDRSAPRSLAELRGDLASKYTGRRYQAMYDLRESTDPAAAPLFRMALHDEDERTQMVAIDGLRRLGCREALPELMALIDPGTKHGVVNFAINAVAAIDGRAAQAAIARATKHPDMFVRRNAVLALAKVGDETVISQLEGLLHDSAVPMAGPRGDKRRIAEEARAAIDAILARTR